jgi:hypothetical protein
MMSIIFLLLSVFSIQQKSVSLAGSKWKFVGYITPANDTLYCNKSMDYTVEFLSHKKLLTKTTFVWDDRSNNGKYHVKRNELVISV